MGIVANILGLLANALYILCYQQKKRSGIILMNIAARVLYVTQYFLLGAFSGVALEIAGALAVVLAQLKSTSFVKKHTTLFIIAIDLMIIALGLFSFEQEGLRCLLPIFGVLFHTSAMWIEDEKWIRRVSICGNPFWFAYNIMSGAYTACIGELLSCISIITAMWRFDRKKTAVEIVETEK